MPDLPHTLKTLHLPYPTCGSVSTAPARRWDDGTIVGNGIQGALAYARTSNEEIVLSQEEIFLPLFPFYGYLPVKDQYGMIRQLVLDGKAGEAQELIKKLKIENGFPFYNTTDPFVGACSLELLMRERSDDACYARSIDFETGEAIVAWEDGTGIYHRRFFVSRDADVIVLKLSSPTRNKLNLNMGLREIEYVQHPHPDAQDIYSETIDYCESTVSESILTHRMRFKDRWESQPINGSYTICRAVCTGGAAVLDGEQLTILEADELLLLIRTIPNRRGEALSIEGEEAALVQIEPDYDALLQAHAAIHNEIFGRCRLHLSQPEGQQVSAETLQAQSSVGNTSPALVETCFAAGRYGIISSTGTMPPLLQGVWTGTWKPRWSGDYTLNGNVQSMVAASLCGNHYECQETMMDYLDSLMDDFRENARELLGFRGVLIPWRASTHGKTHYLSCFGYYHDFPGTYWFAGAGWFAQLYYDYYLYTGDETFFETRLKPFLLDAAALYEDYLSLEVDGVYVLSPSSSPENETADNIWMAPNATMTIAVIKELMRTCLRERVKLGVNGARIERWQEILEKLPDYAIGANGALKEWTWPEIENEEAHRHASHLYPLYYGVAPEIAESPELQDACRVAIDKRMEFRRQKDGLDMAFGFTQMGMAAAHLGDIPLAYESVEYLVNSYWSSAMASLHNVHDVFNLDISGGLPAVIITMLIQSSLPERPGGPWRIELLPCLPDAWPAGSLRGARCRGGFEFDIHWKDGRLEKVKITSLRGEPCEIRYRGGKMKLHLERDDSETRTREHWKNR